MSENTKSTLYRKLSEVITEVEGVAKSGTNTFHKYEYTTAEEMLRAIRGPLATKQVVIMPSLGEITEREIKTAKGGASTITTAHIKFTLVDGESGESHECEWAGQGDDPADKGLGKAYTNAIKTFLREQFMIPQGDDPEADESTDKRAADRVPGSKPQYAGSDKPISVKQRGLIQARARELPPATLAQIILTASEAPTRTFESQVAAKEWVERALEKFPSKYMDSVLLLIERGDVLAKTLTKLEKVDDSAIALKLVALGVDDVSNPRKALESLSTEQLSAL